MNDETRNCKECIFGGHYHFDKGGMPTIQCCHGFKGDTEEEAHSRILDESPCDKYDEGHALYLERKAVTPLGNYLTQEIPLMEMYIYDPLGYSKTPTGRCTSFNAKGCPDGDGTFCYRIFDKQRGSCSALHELNNESRMAEPMRSEMIAAFRAAGISEEFIRKWDSMN